MGTNKLIKDGAGLLTSAKDIIDFYDELKFETNKKKKPLKIFQVFQIRSLPYIIF